jgi:hypothetical protein
MLQIPFWACAMPGAWTPIDMPSPAMLYLAKEEAHFGKNTNQEELGKATDFRPEAAILP